MSLEYTTNKLHSLLEEQCLPNTYRHALQEALQYLEEVIPRHAENHELFIDLLERMEWDDTDSCGGRICSICEGYQPDSYDDMRYGKEYFHRGHTDDCPLSKILHHPKEKAES
jgi:hypothetical protein